MEKKKKVLGIILKQLFLIVWKVFCMAVLIVNRIVIMILSIINSKIEDFLKVKKQNL